MSILNRLIFGKFKCKKCRNEHSISNESSEKDVCKRCYSIFYKKSKGL